MPAIYVCTLRIFHRVIAKPKLENDFVLDPQFAQTIEIISAPTPCVSSYSINTLPEPQKGHGFGFSLVAIFLKSFIIC